MRADTFFVVGSESPNGAVQFRQTYLSGAMLVAHWGELRFADRFLLFEDARRAAKSTPAQYEDYAPTAVWRVEVTAIKET